VMRPSIATIISMRENAYTESSSGLTAAGSVDPGQPPANVRRIQVGAVQAVALYRAEL
jgi:hypothetical protein